MDKAIFYIGQALGAFAVVLALLNYQVKTRGQVLFINGLTTVTFALHYLCLGAWAGMAMNMTGFIRNLAFYYAGKNPKLLRLFAIFFAVLACAAGIVTSLAMQEKLYFVLSVAGITINAYAMSFTDPQNIRKSILVTSPIVLVYNVFAHSYGGAVYESVAILSALIGIVRYRKK